MVFGGIHCKASLQRLLQNVLLHNQARHVHTSKVLWGAIARVAARVSLKLYLASHIVAPPPRERFLDAYHLDLDLFELYPNSLLSANSLEVLLGVLHRAGSKEKVFKKL